MYHYLYNLLGGIAGGQTVVIGGTGFDDSASVTICGQLCLLTFITSSSYTCKTAVNAGMCILDMYTFVRSSIFAAQSCFYICLP